MGEERGIVENQERARLAQGQCPETVKKGRRGRK